MGLCPSRRYLQMPESPSDAADEGLTLVGPSQIQVLRGRLRQKEVVLLLCSESHEDAMDLTRAGGVVDKYEDWRPCGVPKYSAKSAWKSKKGLRLEHAKNWARTQLEEAEEEDLNTDGALLVFVAEGEKGKSHLFLPGDCKEGSLPPEALAFEWGDLDEEARDFGRRRRLRQEAPLEALDALLARRKVERRREGLVLFDDWLLSQMASASELRVDVVLESPVGAEELELHVSEALPAPRAAWCLRHMELDSESDSEENDGGCDAYIDYLRRRLKERQEQVHCADPRELGEGSEELALRESFQRLLLEPRPKDVEEVELEALGAEPDEPGEVPAVPSFEAFFGAASDALYYHPEVKMDYAPFLRKCVKSPEALERFFDRLFFETVPSALQELELSFETRPFTRIRSLIYKKNERRPRERPRIPVKALPLDCYLVASQDPLRTWTSSLAQRVAEAGGEDLVRAARKGYQLEVQRLLADPKQADEDGDYFEAWLRECHPKIYEDIDTSDLAELVKKDFAQSESKRQKKHKLSELRIPNAQEAFAELLAFDCEQRISSRRERVVAKILVDVHMLCLVDVALALRAVEALLRAEERRAVVVVYAGADHVRKQAKFWRAQGFTCEGLPQEGLVGQEDYEDFEPHTLEMPLGLRSFQELFPVP